MKSTQATGPASGTAPNLQPLLQVALGFMASKTVLSAVELMSLNMLIETPGGFDYTGADCQGRLQDAGFRKTRVERLIGADSMVVGIK